MNISAAREKLPALIEMAQVACPGWSSAKWDIGPARPPLIIVETSVGDGIPVDMLPLFNFDPTPPVDDLARLGELACSFLGFSASVKRQIGNARPVLDKIENIPRLPLKMFTQRRLRGAQRRLSPCAGQVPLGP